MLTKDTNVIYANQGLNIRIFLATPDRQNGREAAAKVTIIK